MTPDPQRFTTVIRRIVLTWDDERPTIPNYCDRPVICSRVMWDVVDGKPPWSVELVGRYSKKDGTPGQVAKTSVFPPDKFSDALRRLIGDTDDTK